MQELLDVLTQMCHTRPMMVELGVLTNMAITLARQCLAVDQTVSVTHNGIKASITRLHNGVSRTLTFADGSQIPVDPRDFMEALRKALS